MRCVLIFVGLIASMAAAAAGRVLDPPLPQIGQRASLTLERAPVDSNEVPVGLGVALLPGTTPTEYVVVPVRVGRVGVAFADGDTLWWEVDGRLESVAPELLRPVKSVGEIKPNWWPTILLVTAVLLPFVVWLLRRLRRRRRRPTAFPIPPEPAHRVALRRLDEIQSSGWLDQEAFDRYYVEASHVLREYLQGRYRVPALDWTSSELVSRLRSSGYANPKLDEVGPLLGAADGVKFAAERPTQHSASQWLALIRAFVEATAVELRYSTPEALAASQKLTGEPS